MSILFFGFFQVFLFYILRINIVCYGGVEYARVCMVSYIGGVLVMADKTGLNIRQRKFVDYYLQYGNAAKAAEMAGYSSRNANKTGNRLYNNKDIQSEIRARVATMDAKRVADAEEVLAFLTSCLRGEVDEDAVVVMRDERGQKHAQTVRRQICARDRLDAARQLARRYGLGTPDAADDDGGGGIVIIPETATGTPTDATAVGTHDATPDGAPYDTGAASAGADVPRTDVPSMDGYTHTAPGISGAGGVADDPGGYRAASYDASGEDGGA